MTCGKRERELDEWFNEICRTLSFALFVINQNAVDVVQLPKPKDEQITHFTVSPMETLRNYNAIAEFAGAQTNEPVM